MSVDDIRLKGNIQEIVDNRYPKACHSCRDRTNCRCIDDYLVIPLRQTRCKIPDNDLGSRSGGKADIGEEDFQRTPFGA